MESKVNQQEVQGLRKLLRSLKERCPESDEVRSDPVCLGFFLSFLKSSIVLDNHWRVRICPKAWALACLQTTLEDTSAILSQFVFTKTEVDNRDNKIQQGLQEEAVSCLHEYKRKAVIYASYWLKNKNHKDPWSYVPPVTDLEIPDDDLGQCKKGFLKFRTVVGNGSLLLDNYLQDFSREDPAKFSPLNSHVQAILLSRLQYSLVQLCGREDQLVFKREISIYDELFGTIEGLMRIGQTDALETLGLGQLRTNVDVLRVLTSAVLSQRGDCTDSFFDAVQVSQPELSVLEERRTTDFPNCVRSLFRMQYRRYMSYAKGCDPQQSDSLFVDILEDAAASVLLLCSIRCIAWLQKNFEPEEKFFRLKIQQTFNPANIEFPDGKNLTEILNVLRNSCPQAKFNFLAVPKVIEGSDRENESTIPLQMDVDDVVKPFEYESLLSLGHTHDNPNKSPSPVHSSGSSTFATIMTMIRDDLSLSEATEEKSALLRAKFICDTLGQAMSMSLMDFPNVEFSIKLVSEALLAIQTASGKKDPDFEAGKILFIGLFTPYEIYHGSLNGRRREGTGAQTLGFFTSPELKTRSRALLEMVKFLRSISTRVSMADLLLPKSKIMVAQAKETSNVETLKRKIFVEYRKQRAKDMSPFIKSKLAL